MDWILEDIRQVLLIFLVVIIIVLWLYRISSFFKKDDTDIFRG